MKTFLNKSESTLLASVIPLQLINVSDVSESGEVVGEVIIIDVVTQAPDEDLLDAHLGLGLAGVPLRRGALRLQRLAAELVRPVGLALVQHRACRECYEPEAARASRVRELHDHGVDQLAELLEVGPHLVLRGAVVQPTDEELAHLRALGVVLVVIVAPAPASASGPPTSSTSRPSSPLIVSRSGSLKIDRGTV